MPQDERSRTVRQYRRFADEEAVETSLLYAPVVFHTAVLMYLDRARREEFVALVGSLGVRWIAQEAPGVVPGIAEGIAGPGRFVLSLDGRPLAVTAPHGGRIDRLPGGTVRAVRTARRTGVEASGA
jgi:hypothetical protein